MQRLETIRPAQAVPARHDNAGVGQINFVFFQDEIHDLRCYLLGTESGFDGDDLSLTPWIVNWHFEYMMAHGGHLRSMIWAGDGRHNVAAKSRTGLQ